MTAAPSGDSLPELRERRRFLAALALLPHEATFGRARTQGVKIRNMRQANNLRPVESCEWVSLQYFEMFPHIVSNGRLPPSSEDRSCDIVGNHIQNKFEVSVLGFSHIVQSMISMPRCFPWFSRPDMAHAAFAVGGCL